MSKAAITIAFLVMVLWTSLAQAEELLLKSKKIISPDAGQIPQAPRVSPDGGQLVFEYYTKDKTSLWYATADGKGVRCLTCGGTLSSNSLENAFWHPSGNYLVNNILAYQILGKDPLHPAEDRSLELRGPIQQVNASAEVSHPSLAPDGMTIVFAARTTNIKSDEHD